MTEGKIVNWVKTEGDKLAKGEAVLVVESDKADMDVESFYDGYLATIIVPKGGSAPVGSTIALLAESEDEISLAKAKIPTSTSSSSQETTTPAAVVTEEVVSPIATTPRVSPSNVGPAKMWKETFTPKRIKPLKE
ncbi:PDC-E2 5-like protein [Nicotiana attenuata]|uniref:PDC-E2 5-like protein n=1 Tax=Nicotiana attenuata TaxID=49451 RepID=A0A1J6HUK2_NICAT|nr:PDC-E2 5-like protein [Nicotiana attenuata]